MKRRIFLLIILTLVVPLFSAISEAQNRFIFGVSASNELVRFDLIGASEIVIGPIGIPGVQGLAHDSQTGKTYCITSGGILCTIDLTTGAGTTLQTIPGGPFDFFGITIDRTVSPAKIYLISNLSPHTFYNLDISGSPPFTPQAVGSSGGTSVYGISINVDTTSLYAVDSGNNLLLLDKNNGSVDTPIGPSGQTNLRGITYDYLTDTFYGTTSAGQLLLFSGGGSATVVGSTQIVSHPAFVENIPPTPTPTSTPTATATHTPEIVLSATPTSTATPVPSIVVPGIPVSPPEITVDTSRPKPAAVIILQPFDGASLNSSPLSLRAKTTKVDFRYLVVIKRTKNALGQAVKNSMKNTQKILSKKNALTVRNLEANSSYDVRYRVQIVSKTSGSDPKVVGKTLISPTQSFTIN